MEWPTAAAQLQALGWLSAKTAQAVGRLHAFGRLIGNTDMHQGNLDFHLIDRGELPLAPAYDMLPMSLAPSRSGVVGRKEALPSIAPRSSGELACLRRAAPLASAFWERVAADTRVRSRVLRELARANAGRVAEMALRYGA